MTLQVVEITGEKRRLEGFTPPEGVPIAFTIATAGTRFGAQMLDFVLTLMVIVLAVMGLLYTRALDFNASVTLISMLALLTRVPYYVLTELLWNGRTIGKRLTGIRVISADGRRLRPSQIVARNLMKEAEFLAPAQVFLLGGESGLMLVLTFLWVCGLGAFFLLNKRRQRLGDVIAGTLVVEQPRAVLLPDLSLAADLPDSAGLVFAPAQLDIYGRHELQALEAILRSPPTGESGQESIRRVAATIAHKIGHEPLPLGQELDFLRAFYNAQRAHLERLRLYGTARENKFHTEGQGDA